MSGWRHRRSPAGSADSTGCKQQKGTSSGAFFTPAAGVYALSAAFPWLCRQSPAWERGICRSGHGNRNGNTVWLYENPVRSTYWTGPARMQDHPADGKKHVRQRLPGMTRSQPGRAGSTSRGVWHPAARPEDEWHRYRCCGRWFHAGVQPSVRLPRQPCRQEAKRSKAYGRQDIIWYGAGARPCVPDRPAGFPVHCRRSTAPPATMPANRTSAPARSRNSMSRQRASP